MGPRYCLRILFALFPAYVICLGSYEGCMPTANGQKVLTKDFQVITPEVKQTGSWNDPAYSSVHLPHHQGTHGSYDDHIGSLDAGSNIKSDPKDCQTPAKSDTQENMINFKPSASVSKYDLLGFGQPSAQYESGTATDAFRSVQPRSQLSSSQGGSTLMRTLKVPEPNPLKPSRDKSSYTGTSGLSRIFVVKPPKNEFGNQHSSLGSQTSNNVQTDSSSYGLLLRKPKKPSSSGVQYTEGKSSVVSSGPIYVVRDGGSAQSHGGYSGHPDKVKPLGVPSHVDTHHASQITRDIRLTASSQGKPWNKPLHYSMSGTPYSPSLERGKPSQNVDKYAFASSGAIVLIAPESAPKNKLPPRYETTHPKLQQTYNIQGQPSQIYKPTYPLQSGAQHKHSIASSGAILIIQDPTNVRTESNKPKVQPSLPECKETFGSSQTAHQPFEVTKNSRNVQPATSTYASSSQTVHQTFSSVKGTSYKPNSRPSQPSNEINTVHVRLNKPLANFQNQWASGVVSSGPLQISSSPSNLGPQRNPDYSRRIIAIPSGFGQGAIQRLAPTLSRNYRPENQPQVNALDSSAPKCKVTQNSPAGPGQRGLHSMK